MKVTYSQIEQALNNTLDIEKEGNQEIYEAVRSAEYDAIDRTKIQKTTEYFNQSDWRKVYQEIKKMLSDTLV